MSTISYLDRFLEPVARTFTEEVARAILDLRVDAETQSRVEVLRLKAGEGTLTAEEETEYREFVEAADIVAIFQSKARQFLSRERS